MTIFDIIALFVSGTIVGLIIGMEIGRARTHSYWRRIAQFNQELVNILLEAIQGRRKP